MSEQQQQRKQSNYWRVKFFGTSAAVPSPGRGFACIGLIRRRNDRGEKSSSLESEMILLDCGDGAIRSITSNDFSSLSISNIFITHFHSDHLSGLTSIIETMGIDRRTSDVDVYGPRGLEQYFELVQKVTNVAANRKFKVRIQELEPGQVISLNQASIKTFAMDHTVPCLGYRIEMFGGSSRFVLAYTGDTEPCNGSRELANEVDLLIQEATFLQKDVRNARKSKHTTAWEAGKTAKSAGAKNLIMTHVNDRFESEEEMLLEARGVYQGALVAHDGMEVDLPTFSVKA